MDSQDVVIFDQEPMTASDVHLTSYARCREGGHAEWNESGIRGYDMPIFQFWNIVLDQERFAPEMSNLYLGKIRI